MVFMLQKRRNDASYSSSRPTVGETDMGSVLIVNAPPTNGQVGMRRLALIRALPLSREVMFGWES